MAVDNSLQSLLATLTTSIQSATEAIPKDGVLPPKDGVSLLDAKNELLLSYLQNLVFLILLKIRARAGKSESDDDILNPQDEVVKKLVEIRVYLEKGVKPLEARLKYQVDKLLQSADDAARKASQVAKQKQANKNQQHHESEPDSDEDASVEDEATARYVPKVASFVRPGTRSNEKPSPASKDGIYRPPKITPVSMPTTESREQRQARRPGKSAILDEFVSTELSAGPLAQPSIGSTIVDGGRRMKSEKERKEEAERREYEESNFTRLPAQSKKELRKKDRSRAGGFGGEEWRELDAGLGRIERLTQKKGGSMGSLQKSRKRPVEDGPRGSGSAGEAFEKRRKVVSQYKR